MFCFICSFKWPALEISFISFYLPRGDISLSASVTLRDMHQGFETSQVFAPKLNLTFSQKISKESYCLLVTKNCITIKACGQCYWAAANIALSRRQFSAYLVASADNKRPKRFISELWFGSQENHENRNIRHIFHLKK